MNGGKHFWVKDCPYCPVIKYGSRASPRTRGKFVVYETDANTLIFKCCRCSRKIKYRYVGGMLCDADIPSWELYEVKGTASLEV